MTWQLCGKCAHWAGTAANKSQPIERMRQRHTERERERERQSEREQV